MANAPDVTSVPINDLSRGILRDRIEIERAFAAVLDSGYVVMGPNHAAFQRELAHYLGVTHAIGVASGTDALELSMKAAMPAGRKTVVTAANAGGYATTAARRAGFDVVLADVDEDSLCLNVETVSRALSDDVGVVVVTHLYGNLTDIREIVDLCHARGIRVVEDCAQAIGAQLGGKYAGSFGDIAAISFYPTKNLGAIGDGGAVITDDDEFAGVVRQLSQYGWESKYRVGAAGGTNSRLDEIQAAFLRVRLPLLDSFNERRRQIVSRYAAAAAGSGITVLPATTSAHVAHLAIARSANREEVRDSFRELGVQTDVHFPVPDHLQPGFGFSPIDLPVTERASREVFSLPCFPELTDAEVLAVCEAIASVAAAVQ